MNRRHFLIAGSSALALVQLMSCSSLVSGEKKKSKEEFAVFWHPGRFEGPEILLPQQLSHIIFVDALNESYEIFEIPITAHSIIQDEKETDNIFLFSKWWREVGLFNRQTGRVTKQLVRPEHIRVYGHGVWDFERDGFWYTEHDHHKKMGYLVLCDRELNIKERIPSGGAAPHEVKFGRGGDLLVANSFSVNGGTPCVSIIDSKSLKIKKVIPIPQLNNTGFIAHMVFSKTDNRIFVTGHHLNQDKSVLVQIDNDDIASLLPVDHKQFIGESFSIVHDARKDHLVWINPLSGAMFTWDLKANVLLDCATDNFYVGLLDQNDEVLVTTKNTSSLYRKQNHLERIISVNPPAKGTWGVHATSLRKS